VSTSRIASCRKLSFKGIIRHRMHMPMPFFRVCLRLAYKGNGKGKGKGAGSSEERAHAALPAYICGKGDGKGAGKGAGTQAHSLTKSIVDARHSPQPMWCSVCAATVSALIGDEGYTTRCVLCGFLHPTRYDCGLQCSEERAHATLPANICGKGDGKGAGKGAGTQVHSLLNSIVDAHHSPQLMWCPVCAATVSASIGDEEYTTRCVRCAFLHPTWFDCGLQ
jgi:hypothetical protein